MYDPWRNIHCIFADETAQRLLFVFRSIDRMRATDGQQTPSVERESRSEPAADGQPTSAA
jgi:hypothetical protein